MKSGQVILIADQDLSVRKGIGRLLRASGYDVALKKSLNDLLSADCLSDAGCIILDAQLAASSSPEFQQLTRQTARTPLIIISADDAADMRTQAAQLGASGCFRKPVDGVALIDAIQWAIHAASITPRPI